MFQQEESRAQDTFRFEQAASAWVFQEGKCCCVSMDAIRDEAARELLAERLRMSNVEVAAQGELSMPHTQQESETMGSKIAELMKARRDVTDHRDSLLEERQQSETIRQTELRRCCVQNKLAFWEFPRKK
eukprot:1527717-Amphidinium_carterae.2